MLRGFTTARLAALAILASLTLSLFAPTSILRLYASYSLVEEASMRVELVVGVEHIYRAMQPGILVIPPARAPYSEHEVAVVLGLARKGWTIIILCGPGFERDVARAAGFIASPRPLAQPGLRGLVVDMGSERLETPPLYALIGLPEGSRILVHAPSSWIDYDLDHIYDPGEDLGTHPVAASVDAGLGEIVVISTPSIDALSRAPAGWREIVASVLGRVGARRSTVYIDVSKQPRPSATLLLSSLHVLVHQHAYHVLAAIYAAAAVLVASMPRMGGERTPRRVPVATRRGRWGFIPQGDTEPSEEYLRRMEAWWIGREV